MGELSMHGKERAASVVVPVARIVLPVASLLAIMLLVYGSFASSVGFYWDDWPILWVYKTLGAQGVRDYFNDRPVSGAELAFLFPVLGHSAPAWYVLALILRWLSAVMFYWSLKEVWPDQRKTVWLFCAIFLLYPGFSQQAIAITYVPQHLSLLLYAVSLVATVYAVKREGLACWALAAAALSATAMAYVAMEYYVGLELVRPLIILHILERERRGYNRKACIRKTFQIWAPYVAILVMYAAWKFIYRDVHDAIYDYRSAEAVLGAVMHDPISALTSRGVTGVQNILLATVLAWTRPFRTQWVQFDFGNSVIASWLVGVLVAVLGTIVFRVVREQGVQPDQQKLQESGSSRSSIYTVAIVALLAGGMPVFFAGLKIDFDYPFGDRFTLPFLVGSSLLIASMVTSLPRTSVQKSASIAIVLLAFSAYQFQVTNEFRSDWLAQKRFFWQLAWRLPDLQKGTSLLAENLPARSLVGNKGPAALNLLYNEAGNGATLDYFLTDMKAPWMTKLVSGFSKKDTVTGNIRKFRFEGNTSQSIVIWVPEEGSVRVVTSRQRDEIPGLPPVSRAIAHLSYPERVETGIDQESLPRGPLLNMLGPEPTHEWFYYFQKAELARQKQDWARVLRLRQEATEKGLRPADPSEMYPFIEALAHEESYDMAIALSQRVLNEKPQALLSMSVLWQRLFSENGQIKKHMLEEHGSFVDALVSEVSTESRRK